jgi:hypothetical protein
MAITKKHWGILMIKSWTPTPIGRNNLTRVRRAGMASALQTGIPHETLGLKRGFNFKGASKGQSSNAAIMGHIEPAIRNPDWTEAGSEAGKKHRGNHKSQARAKASPRNARVFLLGKQIIFAGERCVSASLQGRRRKRLG